MAAQEWAAPQPVERQDEPAPPVGDWLVVPGPAFERMWRWGRIVEVLDDGRGPVLYRVRWWGDAHDTVVLPPPDARIESAERWPVPGSGALGLWPVPHPRRGCTGAGA